MYSKGKAYISGLIDDSSPNVIGKTISAFLAVLVLMNVAAVVLETEKTVFQQMKTFFQVFEIFSVSVFTIEYILRLWTCTGNEKYRHPFLGRLRFATTPMPLIDLLAILPFFIPMLLPFDFRFIRILRIFRLLRIFKLGRYSESLKILTQVFKRKKEELVMVLLVVSISLLFISSIMYYIENEAQPNNFTSIFSAMWWGVATLTTVGYGDIYPITIAGKILSGIIAVLGIGVFALPTGIIANGFAEEVKRKNSKTIKCPHCGNDI